MPVQLGYALSSEEHAPNDLVRNARRAEEIGFDFLMISDHYHPWVDQQGHSPFVWSVLGAIAHATERIPVGTGVTAPTVRIHPAILAQATATVAAMMPGRFRWGVGTGENLNEHILGDVWPEYEIRAEMLEEAVQVVRELWKGDNTSHYGEYYTVVNAKVYDRPPEPTPVIVAAAGDRSARLAGRIGDGLCVTSPDRATITAFREAGGGGKPVYGQVTLCWAPDEASAKRTVKEIWPTAGIKGQASQELPSPAHFAELAEMVTEEMLAQSVPCGPDAGKVLAQVRQYAEAGVDHIYLHQVGRDQEGFFRFAEQELLPQAREVLDGGTRRAA